MKRLLERAKKTVSQNAPIKPPANDIAPQATMHKRDLGPAAEIIKEFEGLRLSAYRDSAGIPTIGYGSTKGVKMGMRITKDQANALFDADFMEHMLPVQRLIKRSVNDNQFGAMVSLCFNIGAGAFKRSTLLRNLNNGAPFDQVANGFLAFNKAGGRVLEGLVRRRKLERALFLKPVDAVPINPVA